MSELNEKTSLPLKIVIPICATIMAAAFYIGVEVHSIKTMMQNAWTVHDQDRWEAETMILNPALKLPDAYNIIQRRRAAGASN
jgi:hypothetical protein